jgi:5-methylcytosine-specific restriction endonuclease McrA
MDYKALVYKSGNLCWFCGGPFDISKRRSRYDTDPDLRPSVEHLLPRSRGGTDVPENLVVAHRSCNNEKGMLTLAEYRRAKNVPAFFGETFMPL